MDTSLTSPNQRQKFFTILSALLIALAFLAGCAGAPYVQPFDNKEYDLAITKAKEVLNERPQDYMAWYYLGRSYDEKGQYAEAEKAFYKALPHADLHLKEDILRQIAGVHVKTGDYNRALEEYDKLLKDYPNSNSAIGLIGKGYVFIYLAKYMEALKSFERAVEVENEYWRQNAFNMTGYKRKYEYGEHLHRTSDASRGKAFAYLGLGDTEKALYMIGEATRIYPEYDPKVDLALIYYASDSEDRLKDHLASTGLSISKTELSRYPVIAPLIEIRNARKQAIQEAVKVENQGEYRKAFLMFMKLLHKYPNDIDVLPRIIQLTKKLDPPPATSEEVERYVSRGLTAIKMAQAKSDYMNALEEFKKALQLAPWVPTVYYNMGLVEEQAELYKEAIQSFKFYLLAAPHASDSKQIEKKIYELEYVIELISKQMQQLVGTWAPEGQIESNWICVDSDYNDFRMLNNSIFKIVGDLELGKATVTFQPDADSNWHKWQLKGESNGVSLTVHAVAGDGTLVYNTTSRTVTIPLPAQDGKLEVMRKGTTYTTDFSLSVKSTGRWGNCDGSYSYKGKIRKRATN